LVRYEGRVQGVGFRYTTRGIARKYAVLGYVKNLHDGSVELAVQGTPQEVESFLGAVAATFKDHIERCTRTELPPDASLERFEIRF